MRINKTKKFDDATKHEIAIHTHTLKSQPSTLSNIEMIISKIKTCMFSDFVDFITSFPKGISNYCVISINLSL